jgi:hypothetical protein
MGETLKTEGYVGTIKVETEGPDRIWFSLLDQDTGDHWVKIDGVRAWFQISLEKSDARPAELAKLALLIEAQRECLEIQVSHPDKYHSGISQMTDRDTWDCLGIRVLRAGLHF